MPIWQMVLATTFRQTNQHSLGNVVTTTPASFTDSEPVFWYPNSLTRQGNESQLCFQCGSDEELLIKVTLIDVEDTSHYVTAAPQLDWEEVGGENNLH